MPRRRWVPATVTELIAHMSISPPGTLSGVTQLFTVAIGQVPRTELVAGTVNLDAKGYIRVADPATATNVPGVFACGDVADPTYQQAITAAGSGCRAALDVQHYLAERVAPTA